MKPPRPFFILPWAAVVALAAEAVVFEENNGEYQTAATGDLPAPASDEVSIQCYHVPADAEHWIRFDDFRILKLGD